MTLHFHWPLANGKTSKVDKMSSTHPNLIPSNVFSFMSQREHMRKKSFWDFRFDKLWLFNFQFGYWPKSTNDIILVSAHPILNLKIDPKISQSKEFMVKNPFWDFKCNTFKIPYDSSFPVRAKIRPMTSEKFSKHEFSFFHQIIPFSFKSWLRWHFGYLI